LINSEFFSPTLAFNGFFVGDIHEIHRAVAYVGEHIHSRHFAEIVDNRGETLREDTAPHEIDIVLNIVEYKLFGVILQKIFAEILTLSFYPS
jgi:hypothetical protein